MNKNSRAAIAVLFGLLVLVAGCATVPEEKKVTAVPAQTGKGVYHKVHPGETLWRIAKTYGVSMDDIIKSNRIPDVAKIEKDQLVFIPGAQQVKSIPVIEKDVKDNDFQWPIKGSVLSYFGNHKGLNLNRGIDIQANDGDLVKASRSGKVVFADYLNGYGYTIILDHKDGYHSVYAQNAKLLVALNDFVEQGTPIAEIGRRGDTAFEHFEIRKNARADNPLFYLPN